MARDPGIDVRLRIPSYTVLENAPAGDDGKDLILELKVDQIKFAVSDSVLIFPLPFFHGGVMVPFVIVKETITLTGVTYEGSHVAHSVAGGAHHQPDFIDLEEAVITFGNNIRGTTGLIHLETDFKGGDGDDSDEGWRIYQGVIQQVVQIREAGRLEADFSLTFGVLFDPSTFPGITEWSAARP